MEIVANEPLPASLLILNIRKIFVKRPAKRPHFIGSCEGFGVIPPSWRSTANALLFLKFAQRLTHLHSGVGLGMIATSETKRPFDLPLYDITAPSYHLMHKSSFGLRPDGEAEFRMLERQRGVIGSGYIHP